MLPTDGGVDGPPAVRSSRRLYRPRPWPTSRRTPYGYHLSLCPAEPEPPFDDPGEQVRVWGRAWGAADEVGPLRSVLVRAPRDEWRVVRADCWDERAQALVDPAGQWYWESKEPPDLEKVRAQHAGLVAALEAEGVEVVHVDGEGPPHLTRPIYTRDPLLTVPGGAIIGRMAPAMRRGEERLVTQAVAAAGMPILAHDHRHGAGRGRQLRQAAAATSPPTAPRSAATRRARASSRRCCGASASSCWSCRSAATRSTSTATSGSSRRSSRWSTRPACRTGSSTA